MDPLSAFHEPTSLPPTDWQGAIELAQPEPLTMPHSDDESLRRANKVIKILAARAGKEGVTITREELERPEPTVDHVPLPGGGFRLVPRGQS